MNQIDRLVEHYGELLARPPRTTLAAPERVWFAVHDGAAERRIALRLGLFQQQTQEHGWTWHHLDLAPRFGAWMAAHEYADAYFAQPDLADGLKFDFATDLIGQLISEIEAMALTDRSVLAVTGASSLFGLLKIATLVAGIEAHVPGRLLVFFPGDYDRERGQFRFLDARDGWNYHAVPLTGEKGAL